MNYIVFNKETGEDLSSKVSVIAESTDNYRYCRVQADKMFEVADKFYQAEVQPLWGKKLESSMDDFGPDFDPERGTKWVNYMNGLREQIAQKEKEHAAMMDIAGDWEDREYAARFLPVVNFLSVRSDNPLLEKECKLRAMKAYLESVGLPNMGKYIC